MSFDCRATTTSFMAVAYEYAVEMTYPLPEGTSAGLMNASSQVDNYVTKIFIFNYALHHKSVTVPEKSPCSTLCPASYPGRSGYEATLYPTPV